jgi:hypothetical protein
MQKFQRERRLEYDEIRRLLAKEMDDECMIMIAVYGTNYSPWIKMRRLDGAQLKRIFDCFGGYYSQQKTGTPYWWLNMQAKLVYEVIDEVYDLLEKRKSDADVILRLRESVEMNRKNRGRALSDDVISYRDGLVDILRESNAKFLKSGENSSNSEVL